MRTQNEGEIAACNYHAGMTPQAAHPGSEPVARGVLQVVVATIAFGMGERALCKLVFPSAQSSKAPHYAQLAWASALSAAFLLARLPALHPVCTPHFALFPENACEQVLRSAGCRA